MDIEVSHSEGNTLFEFLLNKKLFDSYVPNSPLSTQWFFIFPLKHQSYPKKKVQTLLLKESFNKLENLLTSLFIFGQDCLKVDKVNETILETQYNSNAKFRRVLSLIYKVNSSNPKPTLDFRLLLFQTELLREAIHQHWRENLLTQKIRILARDKNP